MIDSRMTKCVYLICSASMFTMGFHGSQHAPLGRVSQVDIEDRRETHATATEWWSPQVFYIGTFVVVYCRYHLTTSIYIYTQYITWYKGGPCKQGTYHMWYDSYIHYVTTLALYTSASVYTLVKMVMIWPASGTNWANAQIDTPRALFHHKGLPWDCPLLCFNIFQESISWDLSQHSGICGSEDLPGFQETSSQLTQNKSAENFPNITLQKQLCKTFIHIFFEHL